MLQAPTSEVKAETTQSKSQLVPQPERELHPRLLSAAGPYSASGMNGVASGASPEAQRRQTFAGMQSTHGNQAVLRMLHSPQQVARMSTLRPSQGVMVQRKCGCGGSAEKEGECAECKAKGEGTLQRQAVNPTISPAIEVIQTKLAINQPGDEYEQEADRVSEHVMRMPEPQLQHTCTCGGACPTCQTEQHDQEQKRLQTKRVGSSGTGQSVAPPIVHEVLRSPGQPLDAATRGFMEPRFGHEFSRVRIHTDTKAAESARAIQANAYTSGQNMVFGAGQYAPTTSRGKSLLAHELVHVVQQAAGDAGSTMGVPAVQRLAEGELEDPNVEAGENEPWTFFKGSPEEEGKLKELGDPPGPRYQDIGSHTNWSVAVEQRGEQLEGEQYRLSLERPMIKLDRGGSPSEDFVTEGQKSSSLRSAAEGEVAYTPKYFHVLGAIDHDVALATTSEEVIGLYLAFFTVSGRRGMPRDYKAPNGKIYHPRLPSGAVVGHVSFDYDEYDIKYNFGPMMSEFRSALAKEELERKQREVAEKLAEAENFALKDKGKKRREGPCKRSNNAHVGGSPEHNLYANHVAFVKGYGLVKDELTWTTPEGVTYSFDTYNPKNNHEVWEVKTQHEWNSPLGIGNAPDWLKKFEERFEGLEKQRLKGLYIANRCGLRFKYAFDNCRAYTGFRDAWSSLPPLEYIPYPGETKVDCP